MRDRKEAITSASAGAEGQMHGTGVDPLGLSSAAQARELAGMTAERGVAGSGGPVPHGDVIQSAFGHHDISGVSAHVGGAAATAAHTLGAQAYATGQSLAFAEPPDLHTAAHEAAHAVQQQAGGAPGIAARGGFGRPGDAHEQHADRVADAVVAGRSAAGLLDRAPAGAPGAQLKEEGDAGGKAPIVPAPMQGWYREAYAALDDYTPGDAKQTRHLTTLLDGLADKSGAEALAPQVTRLLRDVQDVELFLACIGFFRAFFDAGRRVGNDWLMNHYLADRWYDHSDRRARDAARAFGEAHLGRWLKDGQRARFAQERADRRAEIEGQAAEVEQVADRATAGATQAVSAGLEAQEAGAKPVVLGTTVLRDPSSGALMAIAPQRLGELADLVVGGRTAAANGTCAHRRGTAWAEVDPEVEHARVVLPGERVRFIGDDGEHLTLVGEKKGGDQRQARLTFQAAAVPYTEAATHWAAERQRRQAKAQGDAMGLSIAAADRGQPFLAHSIPVELEGMAAGRPLYIYDFPASVYDGVMVHGDLRGADVSVVEEAVTDAACVGLVPAVRGTRVVTFDPLKADAIAKWVDIVEQGDRRQVQQTVSKRLAGSGVDDLYTLSDGEILKAGADHKSTLIERVTTGTASGDGKGKALVEKVLASMDGGEFEAVCTHLVQRGTMNTVGHWVNGDPRIMMLMGEGLQAARIIYRSTRTQVVYDENGRPKSSDPLGVMLWVGGNPTWGGQSHHLEFAGKACTVQVGDRGIFGEAAEQARGIYGTFRKNTAASRESVGGAFASGVLDFLVQTGIGTLDMLDRPAEVANALYAMAQDPGKALDAIGKSIGDQWDTLIDAAAHGNLTGDYTGYAELAGKWTAAIVTSVTGVGAAYKGVKNVVRLAAQLRKLGPTRIALFLRAMLKRSGKLLTRRKGRRGYAGMRSNPGLMKQLTRDAARVDDLMLDARKARALADEVEDVTEVLAKNPAKADEALTRSLEASRRAREADQVAQVQRRALGTLLEEHGVIGAQAMKAEDLSTFVRSLADPAISPQTLRTLRLRFINHRGGPQWKTMHGPDPAKVNLSNTQVGQSMKTLHDEVSGGWAQPMAVDDASHTLLNKVIGDTRDGLRNELKSHAAANASIQAKGASAELRIQAMQNVVLKHKVRRGHKDYDRLFEQELETLSKAAPAAAPKIDPAIARRIDKLMPDDVALSCGWGQAASAYRIHDLVPGAKVMLHNTAEAFAGANRHAFLTVRMPNGKWYLVDPTFRQFFGKLGSESAQVGQAFRASPGGKMMADKLLSKGWVELTDETATLYGRAMTYDAKGVSQFSANSLQSKATYTLQHTRTQLAERMKLKTGSKVQKGEFAGTITEAN